MDRKTCSLSNQLGEKLVEQIAHELFNHNLYRSIASLFAIEAIPKLEQYYVRRATEERNHHDWIVKYLEDSDYLYTYPAIEAVGDLPNCDESFMPVFELTVDKEIETTNLINAIASAAAKEDDWQTLTWLQQKLIPEQHEEESISRTAADIMSRNDVDIFRRAEEIYDLLEG